MQIAFITLFLGLVSGPGPVALSAGPGVAAVELMLDGASVARLDGPPWKGRIDFGPGLLPHHLVARALDGAGSEVARAEQWINLPRPPAEVEIAPEKAVPGAPRRVRLTWQSLTNKAPTAVTLSLDGKPLPLDAQHRTTLPLRPADAPTSVLSAELRFPGGLVARKDLALGRDFDDAVATELTAVPVWLRQGRELPPAADMEGWFFDGSQSPQSTQPLRVDAVENGIAQVLVVRDPAVPRLLEAVRWRARLSTMWMKVDLAPGIQMRFVSPAGRVFTGSGIPSELFDSSDRYLVKDERRAAGLLVNVSNPRERPGDPQQLADAAAVAGLDAYATGRPRAVVVVLARGGRDVSRYEAAAVRRYLAAIHVPLFVWAAGSPGAGAAAAWGKIEDCSIRSGLNSGFSALKQALAAQRIVWVEGRHLPQAIALSAEAAAVLELDPPP
jgi:hypothetical protein